MERKFTTHTSTQDEVEANQPIEPSIRDSLLSSNSPPPRSPPPASLTTPPPRSATMTPGPHYATAPALSSLRTKRPQQMWSDSAGATGTSNVAQLPPPPPSGSQVASNATSWLEVSSSTSHPTSGALSTSTGGNGGSADGPQGSSAVLTVSTVPESLHVRPATRKPAVEHDEVEEQFVPQQQQQQQMQLHPSLVPRRPASLPPPLSTEAVATRAAVDVEEDTNIVSSANAAAADAAGVSRVGNVVVAAPASVEKRICSFSNSNSSTSTPHAAARRSPRVRGRSTNSLLQLPRRPDDGGGGLSCDLPTVNLNFIPPGADLTNSASTPALSSSAGPSHCPSTRLTTTTTTTLTAAAAAAAAVLQRAGSANEGDGSTDGGVDEGVEGGRRLGSSSVSRVASARVVYPAGLLSPPSTPGGSGSAKELLPPPSALQALPLPQSAHLLQQLQNCYDAPPPQQQEHGMELQEQPPQPQPQRPPQQFLAQRMPPSPASASSGHARRRPPSPPLLPPWVLAVSEHLGPRLPSPLLPTSHSATTAALTTTTTTTTATRGAIVDGGQAAESGGGEVATLRADSGDRSASLISSNIHSRSSRGDGVGVGRLSSQVSEPRRASHASLRGSPSHAAAIAHERSHSREVQDQQQQQHYRPPPPQRQEAHVQTAEREGGGGPTQAHVLAPLHEEDTTEGRFWTTYPPRGAWARRGALVAVTAAAPPTVALNSGLPASPSGAAPVPFASAESAAVSVGRGGLPAFFTPPRRPPPRLDVVRALDWRLERAVQRTVGGAVEADDVSSAITSMSDEARTRASLYAAERMSREDSMSPPPSPWS